MLKVTTLKETAKFYGCSVAALQQWKKAAKKTAKRATRTVKKTARKTKASHIQSATRLVAYEQFAKEYWQHWQQERSADSSLAVSFQILYATNEALRFAYEYFNK